MTGKGEKMAIAIFNAACNAIYPSKLDVPGFGEVRFQVGCTALYKSNLDIPEDIDITDWQEVAEYICEHLDKCSQLSELTWIDDLSPEAAVCMEDINDEDLPDDPEQAEEVLSYIREHLGKCPLLEDPVWLEDRKDAVTAEDIQKIVPVRHGRWEPCHPLGDNTPEGYMCSVCHVGGWAKTDICLNCGAKMDGKNGGHE